MQFIRIKKQTPLILILSLISASILYLESGKSVRFSGTASTTPIAVRLGKEVKALKYPSAVELSLPGRFINSQPFALQDVIGKKVILIDFWTYSCINCQRTTPYLNEWHKKYSDKGLLILGVHTPEFPFEEEHANVLSAVKKFGIKYPVVQDNQKGIWTAYNNRYWPRKYLIDIDGFIVYDHIGEGGYDETERVIQNLLSERNSALGITEAIPRELSRPANAVSMENAEIRTPEIYFGAARNTELANGTQGTVGAQMFPQVAPKLLPDKLYLEGNWSIREHFAQNAKSPAKILLKYSARDVYMVGSAERSVRVRVLLDGKPVGAVAGEDVVNGIVTIKEDRLYRIIENPEGYGEHTLELEVLDPGLRAFTFTFG